MITFILIWITADDVQVPVNVIIHITEQFIHPCQCYGYSNLPCLFQSISPVCTSVCSSYSLIPTLFYAPHFVGFTVGVEEDEYVPHGCPRPGQPRSDQTVPLLESHQLHQRGQPVLEIQVQLLPELGWGERGAVSSCKGLRTQGLCGPISRKWRRESTWPTSSCFEGFVGLRGSMGVLYHMSGVHGTLSGRC